MLLAPIALTVLLALLPLALAGGFSFANDTYTYCAFSEWLQGLGYSQAARWEAQSPVTGIPRLYQSQHYDLGIAHALALLQAAARPATVLEVYPSLSAFGLALLVSTSWLAARQLLRLGSSGASAVAFVLAGVPHALYWGHHNGFLQQGFALPMVTFGLVLLGRSTLATRWRPATAALVALPFAFLVSVYLPLLPLLAFAALVAWLPVARRAHSRGRLRGLLLFVVGAAGFVAVYSARDLAGALAPLHGFVTSAPGAHVPWRPVDFAQFALGTRVLAPGWVNVEVHPWSSLNRTITPLYAALATMGLLHACRRSRLQALGACTSLVALAAAYYAVAVNDPWSGLPGHTWNILKLAQWSWPFLVLLAALAVHRVAPRRGRLRIGVLALTLGLPLSQAAVHWPWSVSFGAVMGEILPGMTLSELGALKQRIQALPEGTLLVVGRPVNVHRWLGAAVALLAYPRTVVADWTDSASVSNHPDGGEALYAKLLERLDDPHVVPILAGFVPFQTMGVEELGGGFARLLEQPEPVVVHVVNPSGVARDRGGRPRFAVGRGRTKIVAFARTAGLAQLELSLDPYSGRPGRRLVAFLAGGDFHHRSVRLASEGPPVATLPLAGETTLRLALELPRGLSTVVLVLDEGRGELDAREPVTVVGLSIQSAGTAAAGG
jgi:hypothetical protein